MARHRPFDRAPGTELEDRKRQRQAQLEKRTRLTSKMVDRASRRATETVPVENPAKHPPRNVQEYMDALAAQTFYRLGSREAAALTPAYLRLVRSAAEVASDGSAQVVMPWPPMRMSPSAIVALLAIGAVASAEPDEVVIANERSVSRKRADEVRAVFFPYARSTHAQARLVQVDRQTMGEVHFEHLKRYLNGESEPNKDYHQVLARVRMLTGRATDGRDYTEFEHPVLDEIVPHGPPRGDRPSNSVLLWRTRNKTDIAAHTRSGDADDPAVAPYYLFTLRATDRLKVELRSIKSTPDLLILDLSSNARNRLGWSWLKRATEAVNCMREVHPDAGILVLADDPWTYQTARFQLLGTKQPGRKGKVIPASGHVVYSPTSGIIQDTDQQEVTFVGAERIEVDGFFGDVDRNIEQLRGLAHRLTELGDPSGAETVRNMIGTVRRSACLPGSIAEFSRFLEQETSTAMANDQLATYRVAADVVALSDPRSLASQADAETDVAAETTRIMRLLEQATPMSSLLEGALKPALRSSSRSAFVFRSDMIAEFAADHLEPSYPKLTERLELGLVRFGGARVLSIVAAMPSTLRNQFKRAIIVAPTRSAILATLTEQWLPEQVVILADADTLAFASKDAERLAEAINVAPLAARLRAFANRAGARVAEIGRHAVNLDSETPFDDIEFPTGSVVDLSGGVGESAGWSRYRCTTGNALSPGNRRASFCATTVLRRPPSSNGRPLKSKKATRSASSGRHSSSGHAPLSMSERRQRPRSGNITCRLPVASRNYRVIPSTNVCELLHPRWVNPAFRSIRRAIGSTSTKNSINRFTMSSRTRPTIKRPLCASRLRSVSAHDSRRAFGSGPWSRNAPTESGQETYSTTPSAVS